MNEQQDRFYVNTDNQTLANIAEQRLRKSEELENENKELRKTLSEVPNIIQEKEIHIQALLTLLNTYRKCHKISHPDAMCVKCEAEELYEKTIKK